MAPRPQVTLTNQVEINLVVEALQTQLAQLIKTEMTLRQRSETMARPFHIKATAISGLLDRLRVGWKAVDELPPEIMAQMMAKEDTRFWVKSGMVPPVEPQYELPLEGDGVLLG